MYASTHTHTQKHRNTETQKHRNKTSTLLLLARDRRTYKHPLVRKRLLSVNEQQTKQCRPRLLSFKNLMVTNKTETTVGFHHLFPALVLLVQTLPCKMVNLRNRRPQQNKTIVVQTSQFRTHGVPEFQKTNRGNHNCDMENWHLRMHECSLHLLIPAITTTATTVQSQTCTTYTTSINICATASHTLCPKQIKMHLHFSPLTFFTTHQQELALSKSQRLGCGFLTR